MYKITKEKAISLTKKKSEFTEKMSGVILSVLLAVGAITTATLFYEENLDHVNSACIFSKFSDTHQVVEARHDLTEKGYNLFQFDKLEYVAPLGYTITVDTNGKLIGVRDVFSTDESKEHIDDNGNVTYIVSSEYINPGTYIQPTMAVKKSTETIDVSLSSVKKPLLSTANAVEGAELLGKYQYSETDELFIVIGADEAEKDVKPVTFAEAMEALRNKEVKFVGTMTFEPNLSDFNEDKDYVLK